MFLSRTLLTAALFFGLIACSSEKETQPGLVKIALEMAQNNLKLKIVETADTAKAAPQVTREQLRAMEGSVAFVSLPRFGTAVLAVELAQNGHYRTFMGADQTTVTLRHGIITATRGFPVNLITQKMSIPTRSLFDSDNPKTYTKMQRHLTGESTLVTYEYKCTITALPNEEPLNIFGKAHAVHRYAEICRREGRAFQNDYWVGRSDRVVWKSNQSISKEVGHVTFQRIVH